MTCKQLYEIADKIAPFSISEEYIQKLGHHDNSGIMLDCGEPIKGVVFSLDLSQAAIAAAKKAGANCIFTHHPAIWNGIMKLEEGTGADNLLTCIRERISVLSAHLNLDAAPGGIDESLMKGLGGEIPLAIYEEVAGGAYGRAYTVEKSTLEEFVAEAKRTFGTDRIVSYGGKNVRKVASFCGGGFEPKSIAFALKKGADTIVSSDGKHHLVQEAVESGLNVVLLTHYASENYGFLRFAGRMKAELKGSVPVYSFTDARLI